MNLSFKEYFLLEVQASSKNIELFRKKYNVVTMSDEDITGFIGDFTNQVKRGTMKQKDIFGFKDWQDFTDSLELATSMTSGSELKRIEKEQSTRVFENDKVQVIHPQSHEASCHYGAGSQWCTASRSDSSNFREYTDRQDVVLLYFLPKKGFEGPSFKVRQTKDDEATIDHLLLNYPQAFEWSYTQESKSIAKYILAAYLNGRPSEPLSIIAGWSPENSLAVNQARMNMERVVRSWNKVGGTIVMDVLGDEAVPGGGDEFEGAEDYLGHVAADEGLVGFIQLGWDGDTPGSSTTQPIKDYWAYISAVMEQLHQGSDPTGIGQNPVFKTGIDSRWNKVAIAVHAMGTEEGGYLDDEERFAELEAQTDHDIRFGPFPAEAFDAQDNQLGISAALNIFGITPQDVRKMSQYVKQFSTEKVWTTEDPNKLFTFLENPRNQTPENIKRADEVYLNKPGAEFSRGAWAYAREIRSKVGHTKQDAHLKALGDERAKKRVDWPALEAKFIKSLDHSVKEEIRVKDLRLQLRTWDGVQAIQAQLDKERKQEVGGGTGVGAPVAGDWVSDQYKTWIKDYDMPASNFLANANGLLGYLFHVKRYNWPELEKRILDPRYYSIGVTKLGPDWIQHGMKPGDRWKEYEKTLLKMWMDTTAQPFKNQDDVRKATGNRWDDPGTPNYERERAQSNIADHNKMYGNVEGIIDLVKATKRALGGGTGGSEEAAQLAASDAWWNDPEIVKLYWGHDVIVKKLRPGDKKRKKRGVHSERYFVKKDGYIKRPFYHEVRPGAWLTKGIPDPFQIDNLERGIKYVGQELGMNLGEPGWQHSSADEPRDLPRPPV